MRNAEDHSSNWNKNVRVKKENRNQKAPWYEELYIQMHIINKCWYSNNNNNMQTIMFLIWRLSKYIFQYEKNIKILKIPNAGWGKM